jgi:hypothetical protein
MIRKITLLIVLIVSTCSFAQNEFKIPNYKQIEKEIQDKNSSFYYPKLMDRLTKNDTLLSHDDFCHLYFGYVFQPKYNAFWRSPDEKKLVEYYKKIIKLANHSLSDFPFDLKILNFLGYVYHLKGDEGMTKVTSFKFHSIMNAILSSGDGKQCETGFHVILVEHEYMLLNVFEIESQSQALIGNCDYLKFEKGKYKIDGIYFNIEKMLENESKALK